MLPWSGFWDRNYFVHLWPSLQALVGNNFVRGAVSGLGLVNLLAGVFELLTVFVIRDHGDATQDQARP